MSSTGLCQSHAMGAGMRLLKLPVQILALPLMAVMCFIPGAKADTFDVVSKLQDTSAATVWRIDEPDVKQKQTNYPTIKFLPGDQVSVDAGGCVQTGGSGKTWKRYVDPAGPNADRLYHGLIWVPGVTASLIRLQQFGLKNDHQIADPLPAGLNLADLYLRLGYEDDGYGDNGYWSHDDGTGDQCKNVDHAFIIVSIGHAGTLPPDASQFVGITPDKFRCQAAWAFYNFNTDELSWNSFTNAFNLNGWDYVDPATYITYLAARGIASSGNCAGMSLLADVGEDQFVVADLKESFWQTYKSNTGAVTSDINRSHWKQLSAYFLRNWIGTYFNAPAGNAAAIERDLTKADYNYGLLTLAHGTGGHVLVPLRVSHAGTQILIDVYDPNRPCGSIPDPANYPKVIINGGTWSYDMGSDGTWSGSDGLGYIPYVGEDGWSDLGTNISGLTKIVFGNNVSVDQVTDSSGKRLFVDGKPGVIDGSPTGLSRSLFRLPRWSDAAQKRPRAAGPVYALNHALAETPAMTQQESQLEAAYAQDYAKSGTVFIANGAALSDLTFTLSGTKAGGPVRAMVGQQDQFFEVRSAGAASAVSHPSFLVHSLSNFGQAGVTVQNRDPAPLQVTFSHGIVSRPDKTVTIQKTAEMTVSSPTKVQLLPNNELQVLTAGPVAQTTISKQVIGVANASAAPVTRELMMLPLK